MSTSSKPPSGLQPLAYAEAEKSCLGARPRDGGPMISAAEGARREQAARDQGRREGEEAVRSHFEEQFQRERQRIGEAIQGFARERETYYQKVESEVVHLALSIARKILHRESQVDPLLLAGIVRVALDELETSTKVVVRVNPSQAADWRNYFSHHMDAHQQPEVVDDPSLEPGRCQLETALGNTELGLEVQLKEIEQGLLDLLAQRPQASQ